MPKPVYILCAEHVIVDRESNLVSITSVFEKLEINLQVRKTHPGEMPHGVYRIDKAKSIAVWAKIEGDESQTFEWMFKVTNPDGMESATDVGLFEFERGRFLHRFIVTLELGTIDQSGVLKIASLVRRQGASTWQEQSYDIIVESKVELDALLNPADVSPGLLSGE